MLSDTYQTTCSHYDPLQATEHTLLGEDKQVYQKHILLNIRTCSIRSKHALRSDCQELTFTPFLTPTVNTTYCDVVLIICHETSQLDTACGDVQKSSIWDLGSIGGNVNEVGISTVFPTQCPVYNDVHSSTVIFTEVNTGESGDRWGT